MDAGVGAKTLWMPELEPKLYGCRSQSRNFMDAGVGAETLWVPESELKLYGCRSRSQNYMDARVRDETLWMPELEPKLYGCRSRSRNFMDAGVGAETLWMPELVPQKIVSAPNTVSNIFLDHNIPIIEYRTRMYILGGGVGCQLIPIRGKMKRVMGKTDKCEGNERLRKEMKNIHKRRQKAIKIA